MPQHKAKTNHGRCTLCPNDIVVGDLYMLYSRHATEAERKDPNVRKFSMRGRGPHIQLKAHLACWEGQQKAAKEARQTLGTAINSTRPGEVVKVNLSEEGLATLAQIAESSRIEAESDVILSVKIVTMESKIVLFLDGTEHGATYSDLRTALGDPGFDRFDNALSILESLGLLVLEDNLVIPQGCLTQIASQIR